MYIVWILLIGLVAGWLAGILTKGRDFGLLGNLIVGVLGALLGSFVFGLLGMTAWGLLGRFVPDVNYFSPSATITLPHRVSA